MGKPDVAAAVVALRQWDERGVVRWPWAMYGATQMSTKRQGKSGSSKPRNQKASARGSGHALATPVFNVAPGRVVIHADEARQETTVSANMAFVEGAHAIEAELARFVVKRGGAYELQFAQLDFCNPKRATHILRVIMEPSSVRALLAGPQWGRLREACRDDEGVGLAAAWDGLETDSATKQMMVRALFTQMSRFARHSAVVFGSVSGANIAQVAITGSSEVPVEPGVEVTMDLSVMSALLDSMERGVQD